MQSCKTSGITTIGTCDLAKVCLHQLLQGVIRFLAGRLQINKPPGFCVREHWNTMLVVRVNYYAGSIHLLY